MATRKMDGKCKGKIVGDGCRGEVQGMLLCELQTKDVINIGTAKCLGRVMDLEFDEKRGCICTLIVPSPGKVFGFFFHECEYWIPWRCVLKIGRDMILVDVNEKEIIHRP